MIILHTKTRPNIIAILITITKETIEKFYIATKA